MVLVGGGGGEELRGAINPRLLKTPTTKNVTITANRTPSNKTNFSSISSTATNFASISNGPYAINDKKPTP